MNLSDQRTDSTNEKMKATEEREDSFVGGDSALHTAPSSEERYDDDEEEDEWEEEREYSVTLTKGDRGLGFTIAGGTNSVGYFYVKDVLYEPARSHSEINSGDRLVRVDEQDMTGMNHREAIAFLRSTPNSVVLHFIHPSPHVAEVMSGKTKTSKKNDRLLESDSVTCEDIEDRKAERNRMTSLEFPADCSTVSSVITIELTRPADGSLGFSLIQAEKGRTCALLVKCLTPDGAAKQDCRLRVGDRLLQVNGESVIGMPHNRAVALIRRARGRVKITVSRNTCRTKSSADDLRLSDNDSKINNTTADRVKHHSTRSVSDCDGDSARDDSGDSVCDNSDDPRTFDSLEANEAYSRVVHSVKLPTRRESVDSEDSEQESSWIQSAEHSGNELEGEETGKTTKEDVPKKPPRRRTLSRLPSQLTDDWLKTLPLVKQPVDSLHYTGRQLQNALKQLRLVMDRDDPIEEYKSLRRVKMTDHCNVAKQPENKASNRYRNVLPYDSTRVCLSGSHDYINASHIDYTVGSDQLHYIACQGPMPQTCGDFWRMIWEQHIDVIAMVTLDVEGKKVKCHRYWPDCVSTPFTVYNKYEVSLCRVQSLANFDVRHIKMEDLETGTSHLVTHVNFTAWPDHGSPNSAVPLLQYISFLHLVHHTGPMVIHCSAGIGRTGALITIDIVLAMIHRDIKFDIQKIVLDLRKQRQGMIQTKDQYTFCYKACLEALQTLQLSQKS